MKEKQLDTYRPKTEETLGEYLRRLRTLAGKVQGRSVSLDTVVETISHLPTPQRFTAAWLSKTETDANKGVNGDKLRSLAAAYSRLLRVPLPAEWLLAKAGFTVVQPLQSLPDEPVLTRLLRHEDALALLGIVGQLIEKGYADDVRLLVTLAQRYLNARDPQARAGDLFDDAGLSTHVDTYMEALGIL